MGFIARWLGIVPKEERGGLQLDEPNVWEVESTQDPIVFLHALADLLPEDATVYFEATEEAAIKDFLELRPAANTIDIALGTIWPRPDQHHMPATRENLTALADLLEKEEVPLCCHLHAYRDGKMLLEWYDAFDNIPLRISGLVQEDRVRAFADALNRSYEYKQFT
jgi:hypothetical protein